MFATYNATAPGKTLNNREAPGGAVIDKLADGKTVPVDVIERGWCKLDDGYADARFLTITAEPPADESEADDDNATAETGGSENTKTGGSDENADNDTANDGNTDVEDGNDDNQTAEPPADESDELYKMTNPQLYDLAKNSGINVKAGMNKNALVAAILAGAND